MPTLKERLRLPSRKRPAGPTGNDQKLIPDVNAGLWSSLTYDWLTELLKVGFTRQLQIEDVWYLDENRLCATRSKILEESFYMRCPEELRPHYMRTKGGAVDTTPSDPEKPAVLTPDSKETLQDETTSKESTAKPHTFNDPYEKGKTFTTTLQPPEAISTSRRSSAVSRLSVQRDREREASFDRETLNLRFGSDYAPAVETDHMSGDVLSRMETRMSIEASSESDNEDLPDKCVPVDASVKRSTKYDKSLVKAMYRTIRKEIHCAMLSYALYSLLLLMSTLITRQFLSYVTKAYNYVHGLGAAPPGIGTGIGFGLGLVAMQQVAYICAQFNMSNERQGGWLARVALWDAIASKSFRLSPRARVAMTRGRMVTLISADCSLVEQAVPGLCSLVVDPITILVAAGLLVYLLGPAALVGIGLMVACSPATGFLFKRMLFHRRGQLHEIDGRTALMNEVLSSIRSIKLYAYETYFVRRMLQFREKEMAHLRRFAIWRSCVVGLLNMVPAVATVLTFITYALTGHDLDISTIFAALQIFNVLAQPIKDFPMACAAVLDAHVGLQRIQQGLLAEDMARELDIDENAPDAIRMQGSFTFELGAKLGITALPPGASQQIRKRDRIMQAVGRGAKFESAEDAEESQPFQLQDFELRIPRGSLVCVVGRVGSGKTAFAQALLGEMRATTGKVLFSGSVGYCQQSPWIQSCSIRENILFGTAEESTKLAATIRACALGPDIAALDYGIDSQIGERGVTLSGGQQARLQLARVVYANPDVAVLDDPLAAVDSHVAKRLTDECICGALRDKTVILITHHLEVLPKADLILVMQDGKIIQQGSYPELMESAGVFRDLIDEFGHAETLEEAEEGANIDRAEVLPAEIDYPLNLPVGATKANVIFEDEDRFSGSISWAVYSAYLRHLGSYWWPIMILALLALSQVSLIATQVFLGFWTSGSIKSFQVGDYITVYGCLGITQGLLILVVCPMAAFAGLRASFALFHKAIFGVLRAPVAFHDRNPLGRIVSRLSKDVEMIDTQLAWQIYFFLQPVFAIMGAFGLVIYSYALLAVIFVPICIVYMLTAAFYKRSSMETKRLDNLMRSFVYSTFSEQLSGMACIRSHRNEAFFIEKFRSTVDQECRLFHVQTSLQRWLGIRVQTYGNVLVLGVVLFGIGFREKIAPAKLGVVLTYSIAVVQTFAQVVSEFVLLENSFNYVERILHYANLPQEAPASLPGDDQLGQAWPTAGRMEFQDVKMRYREGLPLVLKGISFTVQPGEKVGIVGRTGAGKSSLLQVLLRLVELAEGRILVDGQDLSKLGLDYLRTELSAIPQDSLLFQGTMRENLDPSGEHSDAHLHDVLRKCELIVNEDEEVALHERKRLEKFRLDAGVTTNGDNFSGGEKQLLALARAIVKDSKVILLDEATASVDPETDAKFQHTIRTQFKDNTILCIAHRLQTVAFYDKILVLDAGMVKEFGSPLELYDDEKSVFRSMCDVAKLDRDGILKIRATEA